MINAVINIRRNVKQLSLVLLIALLCSFISHASHFDLATPLADKQECQLCQNNVDLHTSEFAVKKIEAACYNDVCRSKINNDSHTSPFQTPHLRAPPIFNN